ncbi:hypothetical protein EYF80_021495 [Liparis tanakae]|uniref:Uncharacterized protein n=1 Tax=Liparis tanakae TaxID=230148 RepID=A0A4Z2HTW6_9TELE|nr:hypothetical protein EYF80_021495 [Liparis tanakae]
MAAAGCGSATAAAVGGQGGTATARGRFPGRPWSSRSRLRSEKRWQLGRSGSDADDVTNGGPRPANLVLSLNEDQSHLRLLGLEASHHTLGQAGYSSSGSEEVREMTSEGLKLREKAPKDLYGCDKTLLKVMLSTQNLNDKVRNYRLKGQRWRQIVPRLIL